MIKYGESVKLGETVINVVCEGSGEYTVVFMAGSGVGSSTGCAPFATTSLNLSSTSSNVSTYKASSKCPFRPLMYSYFLPVIFSKSLRP